MSYSLVPETEQHYHYSDIVTSIYKTTQTHQICMISLQSSIQMWTLTNYTMHNHYIKQECMLKLKKLPNKLKIKNTQIRFFSYKSLSSMSQKRSPMLSLSLDSNLQTQPRLSSLRAACFTRRKNTRRPESSFRMLLIRRATNATSLTIQPYVIIR